MLINHAGMQATSQNLSASAAHIKGALTDLESNLAKGPRQRWSGEAEAAFTVAHQRWNAAFEELQVLLDRIGVTVFDADTMYNGVDYKSANLFT